MSVINRTALSAAILVCIILITGPLVSCGLFPSDKKAKDIRVSNADIVVQTEEEIPEYFADGVGGGTFDSGVITGYSISAISNDEAAGTVTYETGFSEGGQTVFAEAVPKEGYVLDHWMINGEEAAALGNETTVEIKDISENMNLVAVFVSDPAGDMGGLLKGPAPSGPLRGPAPAPTGTPAPLGKYNVYTYVVAGQETMGKVSGGLASNINTLVQINAIPNPGYEFEKWSIVIKKNSDSSVILSYDETSNPYTVYLGEESTATCNASFKKKNINISLASMTPDQGAGTVTYNATDDVPLIIGDVPKPFAAGGRITVASNQGYYVDNVSFTDSLGVMHTYRPDSPKQTSFNFTIPEDSCKDDIYLHAEFTKNKYIVKVIDDPPEYGLSTIQEKDTGGSDVGSAVSGQKEIIAGNTAVITATPEADYIFDCFVTSSGTRVAGEQVGTTGSYTLTITNVSQDTTITAKYRKETVSVGIGSSPADGGTVQYNNEAEETAGNHTYDPALESGFTLTAYPKDGYTFLCWEDSIGNVFNSKQIRISELKEDRDYTAVFAQNKSEVRITIEPSPSDSGTVRYNDEAEVSSKTEYIYHPAEESGFSLTATPRTGYDFKCWEDSAGNIYNSNYIRIAALKEDRHYTAVFVKHDENNGKGLRVVSEPASGGHVRRKTAGGGKVELTAYPERGWYFVGWKKEGPGEGIFSRSIRVTVDDESVTYVGCFVKDKDYRPTSDIVDMHFYNEKRKVTHPDYTVTRQTMENLAAVSVAYDKVRYANDLPSPHGYRATADVKSYLDGKLAASEIILVEGILTTTKGEVIGTGSNSDIDTLMNSAKDITNRKFGERYDSEIVAAVNTQPPADFDGKVRTYLWKETDTQHNDNIYIMYSDKGSDYKEVAAIADEDGTVRFTLEDDLIGTQFVLVRVTIEDNKGKQN